MVKAPIALDGSIRAASMRVAPSRRDWKFEARPMETTALVDIDF